MKSTEADAAALVSHLCSATNKKLDDETATYFVGVFRGFDSRVGAEVVRRIAHNEQWFPSEARVRHVASEVIADMAPVIEAPKELEMSPVHPDVWAANISVLRDVQSPEFQQRMNDALDKEHPGGWKPADKAHLTACAVFDRVLKATGREPFPDPAGITQARKHRSACGTCFDTGWVESVDESGYLWVEACEGCQPVTARRQREGHYLVGHDCDECRRVRREGRDALDYV